MGFTVWDLGLRAPISASGLGAQIVRKSSDRQKEFRIEMSCSALVYFPVT